MAIGDALGGFTKGFKGGLELRESIDASRYKRKLIEREEKKFADEDFLRQTRARLMPKYNVGGGAQPAGGLGAQQQPEIGADYNGFIREYANVALSIGRPDLIETELKANELLAKNAHDQYLRDNMPHVRAWGVDQDRHSLNTLMRNVPGMGNYDATSVDRDKKTVTLKTPSGSTVNRTFDEVNSIVHQALQTPEQYIDTITKASIESKKVDKDILKEYRGHQYKIKEQAAQDEAAMQRQLVSSETTLGSAAIRSAGGQKPKTVDHEKAGKSFESRYGKPPDPIVYPKEAEAFEAKKKKSTDTIIEMTRANPEINQSLATEIVFGGEEGTHPGEGGKTMFGYKYRGAFYAIGELQGPDPQAGPQPGVSTPAPATPGLQQAGPQPGAAPGVATPAPATPGLQQAGPAPGAAPRPQVRPAPAGLMSQPQAAAPAQTRVLQGLGLTNLSSVKDPEETIGDLLEMLIKGPDKTNFVKAIASFRGDAEALQSIQSVLRAQGFNDNDLSSLFKAAGV